MTVDRIDVHVCAIPTDRPEADGTFAWNHTTIVIVELEASGVRGLGYTYGDPLAASLIRNTLAECVRGHDPYDVGAAWVAMVRAVRNAGRPGIASTAIAAVDIALWDLKARLLGISLISLLGAARERIPVYGSGGFTSYPIDVLQRQLAGWVEGGIPRVKMKIGPNPRDDIARIRAARQAIGDAAELFIDANGAYDAGTALRLAWDIEPHRITWFEEPVSSDDLEGLRYMRERAPAMMDIAAGEYGYDTIYFRRMLAAGAVDVLQADATRCCGITGFLQAGVLADAFAIPLSAHTSPSLHATLCCAVPRARHVEYFHDHVRIETLLFDGLPELRDGCLVPDRSRPGLGLELKRADAARYEAA